MAKFHAAMFRKLRNRAKSYSVSGRPEHDNKVVRLSCSGRTPKPESKQLHLQTPLLGKPNDRVPRTSELLLGAPPTADPTFPNRFRCM